MVLKRASGSVVGGTALLKARQYTFRGVENRLQLSGAHRARETVLTVRAGVQISQLYVCHQPWHKDGLVKQFLRQVSTNEAVDGSMLLSCRGSCACRCVHAECMQTPDQGILGTKNTLLCPFLRLLHPG